MSELIFFRIPKVDNILSYISIGIVASWFYQRKSRIFVNDNIFSDMSNGSPKITSIDGSHVMQLFSFVELAHIVVAAILIDERKQVT